MHMTHMTCTRSDLICMLHCCTAALLHCCIAALLHCGVCTCRTCDEGGTRPAPASSWQQQNARLLRILCAVPGAHFCCRCSQVCLGYKHVAREAGQGWHHGMRRGSAAVPGPVVLTRGARADTPTPAAACCACLRPRTAKPAVLLCARHRRRSQATSPALSSKGTHTRVLSRSLDLRHRLQNGRRLQQT